MHYITIIGSLKTYLKFGAQIHTVCETVLLRLLDVGAVRTFLFRSTLCSVQLTYLQLSLHTLSRTVAQLQGSLICGPSTWIRGRV
jgi:hypothetical protein